MASSTRRTKDHDEIRRWAEERGGTPAHVVGTGSGTDIGILRLSFEGYGGEGQLEPISWDQFFDKFDERNLVLLFQEETAGGAKSNFNKIIDADTAEVAEEAEQERARKSARATGRHTHRAARPDRRTVAKGSEAQAVAAGSDRIQPAAKAGTAAIKKTSAKKTAAKSTAAKKKAGGKRIAVKRSAPANRKSAVRRTSAGSAKKSAAGAGKRAAGGKNAAAAKRRTSATGRRTTAVKASGRSSAARKGSTRKTSPAVGRRGAKKAGRHR
ncbi:MAG: hypothetical protein JOY54_04980 [Acidobacteriaceae bacterium]|nr:hypothetical protein [Acidobacteriaceae bacterium]